MFSTARQLTYLGTTVDLILRTPKLNKSISYLSLPTANVNYAIYILSANK